MVIPLLASLLVAASFSIGVTLGHWDGWNRCLAKWKRPRGAGGKFQRKEPTC
jgi:hypothetical protein